MSELSQSQSNQSQEGQSQTSDQQQSSVMGGGGDQQQGQQQDWRSSLPEDLKQEPSLQHINDVSSLAKSYVHAQKQIGADKIPVPSKFATEDDWQGVFRKLGLPESAEKYDFEAPENAEKEFLQGFKEVAHKAGVLPKQAEKLAKWYNEFSQKHLNDSGSKKKLEQQARIGALKNEWGSSYDLKVSYAKQAVNKLAGERADEVFSYLDKSGLGSDPTVIKLMARAGEMLFKEDEVKGGGAGVGFGMSKDEAMKKYNEILSDPALWDPKHVNHKQVVAEKNKLGEIVYS